ncbi:glutathione S-transferase family protein [Caulobacter sp. NIBR1757]|uniref:glutathione S-transferase family protein n=1 Tax=Caulobacter sp. NIBR1757 TaxID=3016000 RepID=UPI0022F0BB93|nr:glutathione S-transferase family protein [Caulobacter sp. NIBR1757]WGM38125.1 Disulfide-bond oxidoreductase YfcG [Caulobacter sp. NIBR1757]
MITVWGEGRGFRVVWLLEEMGLPYRLRDVDLLKGAESDPEFMAINPGGFIPALQDGEMVMVESVAILQYLLGRYGPSPLAVEPGDPAYPIYLQFLVMGEAGLMAPAFYAWAGRGFGPAGAADDWTGKLGLENLQSRRRLVARQLEQTPYLAGETFTAADICVAYALLWIRRTGTADLTAAETAYVERCTAREGYRRAMQACPGARGWAEAVGV